MPTLRVQNQPSIRPQLDVREITKQRIRALKKHCQNNGKVYLELGCGNTNFSIELARKLGERYFYLGLDQVYPVRQETFPQEYAATSRFCFLPFPYYYFWNDIETEYPWLIGKVEKTFLIMPDPHRFFCYGLKEELDIWGKLAAPQAELHIRTEVRAIRRQLSGHSTYLLIPFAPEAAGIESFVSSRMTIIHGKVIDSFGVKLR